MLKFNSNIKNAIDEYKNTQVNMELLPSPHPIPYLEILRKRKNKL